MWPFAWLKVEAKNMQVEHGRLWANLIGGGNYYERRPFATYAMLKWGLDLKTQQIDCPGNPIIWGGIWGLLCNQGMTEMSLLWFAAIWIPPKWETTMRGHGTNYTRFSLGHFMPSFENGERGKMWEIRLVEWHSAWGQELGRHSCHDFVDAAAAFPWGRDEDWEDGRREISLEVKETINSAREELFTPHTIKSQTAPMPLSACNSPNVSKQICAYFYQRPPLKS